MSTAAAADSTFNKCSIKEFKSQNGRITAPEENIPSVILGPPEPDYLKFAKDPLYHALIENCWESGWVPGEKLSLTTRPFGVLGCSFRMIRVLAVIFSCLHLQNVGNDAINGDVTYQAGEKELLCDVGVHESQGWETCQYTGQPGKTKNFLRGCSPDPNTSPIFLFTRWCSGS